MATARFGSSSSSGLLPCQKRLIVSLRSTLALFEELRQVAGFSFLLTARLNQDALESFFSTVRAHFGSNLSPSPVEFLQRIQLLLICAQPAAVRDTAVQPECAAPATFLRATSQLQPAEETDSISSALAARVFEPTGGKEAEPGEETEELESELVSADDIPVEVMQECQLAPDGEPTEVPTVQAESHGVAYAAGFLAAKSASNDPSLGVRTTNADEEDVPSDAR
ncbi:Transposable element P transposase [Amphibalanus amphitrite]|uniref:Transposable element P transposase n=1 Tax=Amphibalanus amphitrite TaxID=1232801 RepID=A0A6A4WID7_AMPAM|nr:Transposable element P transposase [Amphibalanus amphitrite]